MLLLKRITVPQLQVTGLVSVSDLFSEGLSVQHEKRYSLIAIGILLNQNSVKGEGNTLISALKQIYIK